MPAIAPYIPAADPAFAAWLDNFSALLTAAPATYGQTSGVAAAVAAVTATWDAAYALVTSPSTKTKDTVQAKNVARINALAEVKPVAQQISLNQGVLASDKVAIGVNPHEHARACHRPDNVPHYFNRLRTRTPTRSPLPRRTREPQRQKQAIRRHPNPTLRKHQRHTHHRPNPSAI